LAWQRAAKLAEVPEGALKAVEVAGEDIALCRVAGEVYAVSNVCSHAFALLSEGTLEGFTITCPRHGGQFDVRTGRPLRLPAIAPIASYPVQVAGEDVLVEVED
jgi:nitrite reductase/ring-hydroxylating ferredoxin subunit